MLPQLIDTLSSLGAASGLHHVDRDDPRLAQLADFARALRELAKTSDAELDAWSALGFDWIWLLGV